MLDTLLKALDKESCPTVLVLKAASVPPLDLRAAGTDEGYKRARRKESERQRKKMLKYQR